MTALLSSSNRSQAFAEYLQNRREVVELLRALPPVAEQLRSRQRSELANAICRACVVLHSSHLERYVESLIVEAVDSINSAELPVVSVPEALRMAQVEVPLRAAYEVKDMNKKIGVLRTFVTDLSWFWADGEVCTKLRGEPLISGFDNPLPNRIDKLFEKLGVNSVVGRAVALDSRPDRGLIEAKVREMVEKRNAIAHTGMTTDLTHEDVRVYLRCSRRLVRNMDIIVGQHLQSLTSYWPFRGTRR